MTLLKSKPYIKSYDREADRERRALHETVTSRRCDRDADADRERQALYETAMIWLPRFLQRQFEAS